MRPSLCLHLQSIPDSLSVSSLQQIKLLAVSQRSAGFCFRMVLSACNVLGYRYKPRSGVTSYEILLSSLVKALLMPHRVRGGQAFQSIEHGSVIISSQTKLYRGREIQGLTWLCTQHMMHGQ